MYMCIYIYIYIYNYIYIYIHYMFHDTTLYQLHFDIDKSCTDLSRTLIKGMGPLQSNLMTLKVMCILLYIHTYRIFTWYPNMSIRF